MRVQLLTAYNPNAIYVGSDDKETGNSLHLLLTPVEGRYSPLCSNFSLGKEMS